MEMLKEKFSGQSFWKRIESDLAIICSELHEPDTLLQKGKFIKQLTNLKEYLLKKDILEEDLKFIDDEIELHEQTSMISLYEEKEDYVDPIVISSYARLGKGTEGLVAIPQDYNYTQLTKLTNGVYDKTGLVKFYISREQSIYGKITAEIYEHSQEIPIATVIESKKKNKETEEPVYKGIKLFGQRIVKNEVNVIKEINLPFYVYRFITEENNELILITSKQCTIGDYIITGVQTQCEDFKMLTDSAKLPTKLPFFFAQRIQNRIIQYKNHKEFFNRLKQLDITKENVFDYPFSILRLRTNYTLLQPVWYKWLIWAWLTHSKKGIINDYPLHLMIIGPKMSGKSLLLNTLYAKSKETKSIFSGVSSTLKSLVPSFFKNPARIGYLAESNRFSFCDEFLRCLSSTKTSKEISNREENVAIMNDLLEHQKREAGSGISRVNVNMTSRIIATTNPIRGIKNVEDLVNSFDESFLSRWLIYYQTDDHVQMVRRSNDSDLKRYDFKLGVNDWISFLDYLHTFSAEYDLKEIRKIHQSVLKALSETLNRHYDARHMHHLECLLDGIIKTRCFLTGDMDFKVKEEDYTILKEIWSNIIKSWINPEQIKLMNIEDRIFYLSENCQYLYWKIYEKGKDLTREEVKEIALEGMAKLDFYESFNTLIKMGLLYEEIGLIKTYFLPKKKE